VRSPGIQPRLTGGGRDDDPGRALVRSAWFHVERVERRKRESGVTPELPRSGEWERPPSAGRATRVPFEH
jgi:hypothetical protein